MGLGTIIIYFAILMIIPLWAQSKVKGAYHKYSRIGTSTGMTGYQTARKILDDNGLFDVKIKEVKGTLTDHYNPKHKTVNLSSGNFHGASMAAVAVSAHEVGHAIQDQEDYTFLKFRSTLVPVASFGSSSAIWIILAGTLLSIPSLQLVGIFFMAFSVLFQLARKGTRLNSSHASTSSPLSCIKSQPTPAAGYLQSRTP